MRVVFWVSFLRISGVNIETLYCINCITKLPKLQIYIDAFSWRHYITSDITWLIKSRFWKEILLLSHPLAQILQLSNKWRLLPTTSQRTKLAQWLTIQLNIQTYISVWLHHLLADKSRVSNTVDFISSVLSKNEKLSTKNTVSKEAP